MTEDDEDNAEGDEEGNASKSILVYIKVPIIPRTYTTGVCNLQAGTAFLCDFNYALEPFLFI